MTDTSSPNSSKNISSYAALLSVTHPFIPSQEGKPHTQHTHYQQKSSIPTSPLERGRGCVTSEHSCLTQNSHLRPDRYLFAQPPFAISHPHSCSSLSHTPSSPLERGNNHVTSSSLLIRNKHFKPPLWRGVGGVSRLRIATQLKSIHPKPDRYLFAQPPFAISHPHSRSSLSHTPSSPLKRGISTK